VHHPKSAETSLAPRYAWRIMNCLCFCLQVGIVGRTGSGKTTLLMALFRMIGLAGGRIVVDGVDIGNMPLREVRLAINPPH
jgi:ABC-type proline/glycine betaine transport system ATPase subunit